MQQDAGWGCWGIQLAGTWNPFGIDGNSIFAFHWLRHLLGSCGRTPFYIWHFRYLLAFWSNVDTVPASGTGSYCSPLLGVLVQFGHCTAHPIRPLARRPARPLVARLHRPPARPPTRPLVTRLCPTLARSLPACTARPLLSCAPCLPARPCTRPCPPALACPPACPLVARWHRPPPERARESDQGCLIQRAR